jgi:hypothetical protein
VISVKSDETQFFEMTLYPNVRVREEGFALLFYPMAGPRLYFIASGRLPGAI